MRLIEIEMDISAMDEIECEHPDKKPQRFVEYNNTERLKKICDKLKTSPSALVSKHILSPLTIKPMT